MKAVVIGRFQPFHNGHLWLLKRMALEGNKVIVVIGSFGKKDIRNPFSFSLRKRMIVAVLEGNHIDASVLGKKDCRSDLSWAKGLRKRLGRVDVIYSADDHPWLGLVCAKKRIVARHKGLSATRVRMLMRDGIAWKSLVPAEVYRMLKE